MFELLTPTPPEWAKVALADFDAFLIDHASCERKASAVGMSFIVRYPDRREILEPMIVFAREELEHFHQVYKLILKRGLSLWTDEQDPYVGLLMKAVRHGREERFLDRLLVSSVIEARGHERLHLVADFIEEPEMKAFYRRLAKAEGQHKDFFVEMARFYFSSPTIDKRMGELLEVESAAISTVPFRSALH